MGQKVCMDVKTNIKDYWNRIAAIYDKWPTMRNEEVKQAYRKTLGKVLKGNKLNILDVGTGTGFLALILAEAGHNVTGLDLTEGMLEIAKRKAKESNLSIDFQLGDAEDLPFGDESFDAVVCRCVLSTLPNPQKALAEWVRVTKPKGQIVVIDGKLWSSSLVGCLRQLSLQLAVLIHQRAWRLRSGYSKETRKALPLLGVASLSKKIIELFQQAGLSNISVENLEEIREIQKKNLPFLYRLAYSPPMFLIKGEKHV